MQLLSKRELNQAKQADRQREIEEGLKLARRVDGLRETASEEEAKLTKFRIKSVEQLHSEIKPLEDKKQSLLDEVRELEHRKKIAQIPLVAEWKLLTKAKEELEKLTEEIFRKKSYLAQKEKEVVDTLKQVTEEKARVETLKRTTLEKLTQSENTFVKAQKESDEVKKQAESILSSARLRNKDSLRREADVSVLEREIKIRQESLLRHEVDLTNRERAVKDKYQTLLRTQKRHGRR